MSYEFTFLRHGLSVANQEQILQGQHDSPLSEEGRRQVDMLVSGWISDGIHFDLIISSPLLRARQTAEIIAEKLKTDIEFDEIWMERHGGQAEGLDLATARTWYEGRPLPSTYEPLFENGESQWAVFLRAGEAVQALLGKPPGSYLIVSHGGILGAAIRAILGVSPNAGRYRPTGIAFENTGYAVLHYDLERANWTVIKLNTTNHLET
jgi:broad specificity phosphatase PhoE